MSQKNKQKNTQVAWSETKNMIKLLLRTKAVFAAREFSLTIGFRTPFRDSLTNSTLIQGILPITH